jgi:hypothetical protein
VFLNDLDWVKSGEIKVFAQAAGPKELRKTTAKPEHDASEFDA